MFVVPMMLTDERRWSSTNGKMITMIVVEVELVVMMKVKEAEKKTEKDRALVKEGCGHIRSEAIIFNRNLKQMSNHITGNS